MRHGANPGWVRGEVVIANDEDPVAAVKGEEAVRLHQFQEGCCE